MFLHYLGKIPFLNLVHILAGHPFPFLFFLFYIQVSQLLILHWLWRKFKKAKIIIIKKTVQVLFLYGFKQQLENRGILLVGTRDHFYHCESHAPVVSRNHVSSVHYPIESKVLELFNKPSQAALPGTIERRS